MSMLKKRSNLPLPDCCVKFGPRQVYATKGPWRSWSHLRCMSRTGTSRWVQDTWQAGKSLILITTTHILHVWNSLPIYMTGWFFGQTLINIPAPGFQFNVFHSLRLLWQVALTPIIFKEDQTMIPEAKSADFKGSSHHLMVNILDHFKALQGPGLAQVRRNM